MLPMTGSIKMLALDMVSQSGRVEVVRELIRQPGIEGCGGTSRGKKKAHLDHFGTPQWDTGPALRHAIGNGHEAATKFLLRQWGCCHKRA